ncbi:hypothetical protein JXR74_02295 [Candidatus Mcinerneyibacteriota bacterium]|nr:hypothetical protein [Candidatus Mcinerneyibacteriota bacterium]
MSFLEKLDRLDRRIIFLIIGIAVFVPLLFRVPIKVVQSPIVQDIYEGIEALPEGSMVLLSFDYDPSTLAELQPMSEAVIKHCILKKHRMVFMGLWPQGPKLAQGIMETVAPQYDLQYGVDYVNLGYKTGGMVVISSLGSAITDPFPTDMNGVSLRNLPIFDNVKTLRDFDYVVSMSAGDPGIKHWVMIAKDRFKVPVGGGVTAVSAPAFYAYYNSGQLEGLMGGLRGAAEYETLIDTPGTASYGMSAQNWAHLMIILFIIIGNTTMLILKRKKEKSRVR